MMIKQQISKFSPYLICSLAAFFYVYDYFIQVSPAVMTHQLMQTFQIGAAGLGLLGSIFFYAYAGMQIPVGILLDRYPTKWLLSIAVLISGLGVLLLGVTNHFALAAVSRILVGFGSAFSFVGTIYLISQWFDHSRFAFFAGLLQFAGCMGSIFGEVPLAHSVNLFGWRETLIGIAFVTFVLSFLFWTFIREKNTSQTDHPKDKNSVSLRASWEIFKIPSVWWIALVGFLCWVPASSLGALWGVPYLMQVFNWTNTKAAAFLSLFWISLGIAGPIIGWCSDYFKIRKTPFYICFFLGTIGSLLLIEATRFPVWVTAFALILLGLAPGVQSLTFGMAKDILPRRIFGLASGFLNMATIVGGGLSQFAMGIILSAFWNHHKVAGVPIYTVANYHIALLLVPICLMVGFIITHYFLPETNCEAKPELTDELPENRFGYGSCIM